MCLHGINIPNMILEHIVSNFVWGLSKEFVNKIPIPVSYILKHERKRAMNNSFGAIVFDSPHEGAIQLRRHFRQQCSQRRHYKWMIGKSIFKRVAHNMIK